MVSLSDERIAEPSARLLYHQARSFTAALLTVSGTADLCPYRPGLAPLTQLRPLSTLLLGECYSALADGRVERRQLEPVLPPVPVLRLVHSSQDLQP